MRLRHIKNALDKIKMNPSFVEFPMEYKGKWAKAFDNSFPIHIEIGCGKGQFITQLAEKNPNINFIAIEKYDSVLLRTSQRVMEHPLSNLKLILLDASMLLDVFAKEEIDRIYINFSDPWPKACHAKRRLTYPTFLKIYEIILKEDGAIFQKTDNRQLFEFSIESFSQNHWLLSNLSLNLHKDNLEDNIMTEFEEKWSKQGPIYRLEARKDSSYHG